MSIADHPNKPSAPVNDTRATYDSEGPKLGALLVDRGLLSAANLKMALEMREKSGRGLIAILLERSLVSEMALVSTIAGQLGLEFVDLTDYRVDPAAAQMISANLSTRYLALPIGWDDGRLV